jgi:hypothetical protein
MARIGGGKLLLYERFPFVQVFLVI